VHEPSILRALTPSWSLLRIWQVEDLNVNVHLGVETGNTVEHLDGL
jgi:hypothetical protein